MFRNSKQVGKVAKARGLARAAVIAGVIIAGAGTGYLVSTTFGTGSEQTGYCLYTVSVVPQGCLLFHLCNGVEIHAVPQYNNVHCPDSMQVCGGVLAVRYGSGAYSGTCPD